MKANELRGREAADVRRELTQLQKQLFDLRFQWQAEEKPDSSHRQSLRKDIARCKTVLREMEMEHQQEAAPRA